jgi:hypothetical protein
MDPLNFGIGGQSLLNTMNDHIRTMVTPHHINGNPHKKRAPESIIDF